MYSIRLEGDTRAMLGKIRSLAGLDKKKINSALGTPPVLQPCSGSNKAKARTGGAGRPLSVRRRRAAKRWCRPPSFAIPSRSNRMKPALRLARTPSTPRPTSSANRGAPSGPEGKALRFQIGGRWVSKKQVRIKIPARPFLGLSEEDMQDLKATVEDFIGKEG